MEMADEKVEHLPLSVFSSHAMPAARNDQEVEVFVGLYQGIHHLHGRGRIDVGIHFAQDQEEMSPQTVSVVHVG